jgi:hypothetical protein
MPVYGIRVKLKQVVGAGLASARNGGDDGVEQNYSERFDWS